MQNQLSTAHGVGPNQLEAFRRDLEALMRRHKLYLQTLEVHDLQTGDWVKDMVSDVFLSQGEINVLLVDDQE
jgi:hypothetical protein